MTVAALFVERGGVYWDLPGVDPWDEDRDGRLYDGPYPVVAHPPCARWCQLAHVNQARWGTKIGEDGGCFKAALEAVRRWGGVLEHPAYTIAWPTFGLPVPGHGGWTQAFGDPGFSTAVSQVAYGHRARKRTWLYYVGSSAPPALRWDEPPATAQVGGKSSHPNNKSAVLQHGKSSVTPAAFRDVLLAMARTSLLASEAVA